MGRMSCGQDLEDADMAWPGDVFGRRSQLSYAARIRTFWEIDPGPVALHILYECRPYELGWLLYALAQPDSQR